MEYLTKGELMLLRNDFEYKCRFDRLERNSEDRYASKTVQRAWEMVVLGAELFKGIDPENIKIANEEEGD